ncbi:TetR family transcriptional regulator [Glaciihabitans tibetensis]|uniref:TetR family transcriptional regulator n=1 Tax=Glaciihabitans tibetensis TaxID=1266600 RepID=A0A2T0VD45_9MICO|nr:TetR/AcrR family transcriptional regulator [Glaciihabitans tibetensis]PRY68076.1 TetR family transcriptional regulator [Glaciihabitans tibetensis]
MPRLVEHGQRRAEILEAVWRVVRARGLEQTTTRAIAEEAGCSLSVLAHYFGGKDEIILSAQTAVYERIVQRAFRLGGDLFGLAALEQALLAGLPLDEERVADAQVTVAFASAALSRPLLADARRRSHHEIRRLLYGCLAEARELDELGDGVTDSDVVDEFIVLVEGIGLFGLLDGPPDNGMNRRLTRLASDFVARLRR